MKLLMNVLLYAFVLYKGLFSLSSTALAANEFPSCQDKKLVYIVNENIANYLQQNPNKSVRETRRRSLLLKNLNTFTEINPTEINHQSDFLLASRLVTLKINKSLLDNDIRICQSSGAGEKYKIFLIIYPSSQQEYNVEIINFLPPEKSGEVFDFVYQ